MDRCAFLGLQPRNSMLPIWKHLWLSTALQSSFQPHHREECAPLKGSRTEAGLKSAKIFYHSLHNLRPYLLDDCLLSTLSNFKNDYFYLSPYTPSPLSYYVKKEENLVVA